MAIRAAILTISDRSSRGERPDASGPAIADVAKRSGWEIVATAIVPDDIPSIQQALVDWIDGGAVDLVLTTGGTGFAPRDVTPEATTAILERMAPGLAEGMRLASLKATPHAMLSRAVAGIRKRTLVINLPGSPKAAVENLQAALPVIPHAIELLKESPAAEAGHHSSDLPPSQA